MRCPICANAGSLGILQQHRRRRGSRAVTITFFCSACCIEFTARNGRITHMVLIDDDGETKPLPLPRGQEKLAAHA